jgi:hypothetical protein
LKRRCEIRGGHFEKKESHLMKDVKKRNIIRIVFFICAMSLSPAAVASAQPQGTCSTASAAGTWGFTDTGTLILLTGPVPFAAVGTITGDAHGNFSGTQTTSVGGRVSKETFTGTGTVNSDCTGTQTFSVYDESGTTLLRMRRSLLCLSITAERSVKLPHRWCWSPLAHGFRRS